MPIAVGQIKLENEYALKVNKVLICDTDLLETRVYSETFYNGYCHPMLKKYSVENTFNLYFLTNIDVPCEADDLRDRPMRRKEMFEAFKSALDNNQRPYGLF
ncbi:ATP-binding protein [Gaetbulibacter saemankumensis]|uniref:ATP-binding protein n=1 Tax=Gaetbulibacter saemankumensis TaxID=311208 RepID=UPI0003F83622|nr:ATP-binding protein [Gaetbulibacter saemankumensis]